MPPAAGGPGAPGTPAEAEALPPAVDASKLKVVDEEPSFWQKILRAIADDKQKALFAAVLVIPALAVLLYQTLICDPMYVSESVFALKSNSAAAETVSLSASSFLGGNTNNDIYIAKDYIQSPDMFMALDEKFDLIGHYSPHDLVHSIPEKPTVREISEFWKDTVSVKLDSESELVKIAVKAYDPEFSKKLAENILKEVEVLINNMNTKAQNDTIRLAREELANAQSEVERTAVEMERFRDDNTVIDPSSDAASVQKIIYDLEGRLAESRAELDQKLKYIREDNVEIRSVRNRIESIEIQLEEYKKRLAGAAEQARAAETAAPDAGADAASGGEDNLSHSVSRYERIKIRHEFALKMLEIAMTNLESARKLALSKARYLVPVEEPKLPDETLWPEPLLEAFVTFLVCLFGWGFVSLIVSAILEHMGI